MALSNMLKMLFNHLKKSYAIYSIVCIIIGVLLFIPGIRNININFVSIQTICNYAFLMCCLFSSTKLGNIIFSEYGKTFSVITNNKTPIIVCGIICGLANSLILSIIFLIFRFNIQNEDGSIIISFISIFLTLSAMFFLGSCHSLLLKDKKKIVLPILIIILTILISFKTLFLEYFDFYVNLIFFGYKDNSSIPIISLLIINVLFAYTALIAYVKPDIKKSTFKK